MNELKKDYKPTWFDQGRRFLLCHLIKKHLNVSHRKLQILELGSGIGINLAVLLKYGNVDVIEPYENQLLTENKHVRHYYKDIPPFRLNQKYDLIVAMDVFEHIHNDREIFNWIQSYLNNNGILIVTVPAYQILYSEHDRALKHYRRYSLSQLRNLGIGIDQISIIQQTYFNMILFPLAGLHRILNKYSLFHFRIKSSTNDKVQESRMPFFIDKLFKNILYLESFLIKYKFFLPFGLTALILFKKSNERAG